MIKKYEIRSIGLWSVLKFYALAGFLVNLVLFLLFLTAQSRLAKIGLDPAPLASSLRLNAGLWQGLLACIVNGVLAGIGAAVCAVIYNMAAAILGGVAVRLNEKS
ncbi:MAG: DUF3566 domain-containing protein [Bacillota bacterium]